MNLFGHSLKKDHGCWLLRNEGSEISKVWKPQVMRKFMMLNETQFEMSWD